MPFYVTGRIDITTDNPSNLKSNHGVSRNWRQILPGLVVSAIAIAILLYLIDIQTFVQAWGSADYRYLLLAIIVTLIWLAVRAVVWRTLLEDKASYSAVFWTLNEGYLLNNLLPFRLGEIGRAFLLSRKAKLGFWQVISSILIERGLDLAIAVGLLLITLSFVVGADWASQAALGSALLIIIMFTVLYLLARNNEWAIRSFENISARWPFLLKVGRNAIPSFLAGLSVLTDYKRFLRAIGWMIVNWLITIAQYYIVISAFVTDPELLWAAFAVAVGSLGIAAPSSPGAVGVYELVLVGAFSVSGLDASVALAIAFSLHFIAYATTGVLGVYALVRDGETLVGLYKQTKRLSEERNHDQ